MMKKILVTTPLTEALYKQLKRQAEGGTFACDFTYHPICRSIPAFMIPQGIPKTDVTREELLKICDFSAMIGDTLPELLAHQTCLEWLQLNSAGYERFLTPGALPDSCALMNARGVYGTIVSEHMIALTFDAIRRLSNTYRNQCAHMWKSPGTIGVIEGAAVVIVGLGDIGTSYAKKMKALGAYTIGVRKSLREKPDYLDEQVTVDMLDSVLPRADIVSFIVPGGPETKDMMDERRMRLMKKGSVLINAGRGNLIDRVALMKLLNEEHFLGVGLDVTDPEPLSPEDPLWDFKNLTITPHAAGLWTQETIEKLVCLAGKNVYQWTHGGSFVNVVREPVQK